MAGTANMNRNFARAAVALAMILVGLALVFDILYSMHGSTEMFPTPEQQEKVRLVTTVIAVALAAVEIVLRVVFRRLGRGEDLSGGR